MTVCLRMLKSESSALSAPTSRMRSTRSVTRRCYGRPRSARYRLRQISRSPDWICPKASERRPACGPIWAGCRHVGLTLDELFQIRTLLLTLVAAQAGELEEFCRAFRARE